MEKLGWHSLGTSFDCECGLTHSLPIEACYVGEQAAEELVEFAHGRCGVTCLAVSDENTRAAGGERLLSLLGMRHLRVAEHCYPGAGLEATEERAGEVARAGMEADFYVGIGAGTISDLVKDAGSRQGKPVLLFPTAASMNGYTSAIVALKVRGLKRTLPCKPATGIFADPAVAATAPPRMTAAGVADFLSKCSSAADWRAAHLLRGDYYCSRPREFSEGIQEQLFQQAPAIGRGEPPAVRLTLEALLLSGFGMVVAGSSAPASGGEHLLSHYLDMKHALYGTPNDLHGIQVGVGTVYTLGLWERVLQMRPEDIVIKDLVLAHPAQDQVRQWVMQDWGAEVGEEVWGQWVQKAPSPQQLRGELERVRQELPRLRAELSKDLQPAALVARCIEEAGGPTTPAGMHAPVEEFEKAMKYARFLRNRFTVLDLAAELGIA
ncbi:MAG: iron-containing alcohol dehydrogenase [Candidatus Hydrogenedentes bacterium]|nr:iron-containing alcohol dehydrogenase [Candidatus Hydrogenedentota bacterium]